MKYYSILLLAVLSMACGEDTVRVGDCLQYKDGAYHVTKVSGNTIELVRFSDNKLGYDLLSRGPVEKLDCSIAHEVIESNKKLNPKKEGKK